MRIFGWDRLVEALELQLAQQRGDYEKRLAEKDTEIKRLRAELVGAKIRPEPSMTFIPVKTPAAVALQEGPLDWQGELNKMLQEEEDGIRDRGRIQEHQPRTDDGA